MRLFKCQNSSSSFWPLLSKEKEDPASADKESEASDLFSTLALDLGSARKPIS